MQHYTLKDTDTARDNGMLEKKSNSLWNWQISRAWWSRKHTNMQNINLYKAGMFCAGLQRVNIFFFQFLTILFLTITNMLSDFENIRN